jgi:hypothetical protein
VTGEHNFRRAPHILFLTALFISIAGFLGYYDGVNFITPPSAVVLGAQLILITAAISVLRMRMFEGTARLAPLFALAIWAALTILWTDDALISTRRWLLIFVPSIGLALLAATDSRPERSFTWIKWLLIAITLGSCIFSLIIYAFGETYGIQGNRHKFERFRVLDLGGWVVGVSEGGRQYLNLNLYIHRFSGFTTNPNSFALFAALALISLCATARTKIKSGGWIEITLILITAVILAMSASRAAVAMAFAGLFIIFLLRFGQRNLARPAHSVSGRARWGGRGRNF